MAFENIRRALLYIDANLGEELTVEAVATRHHFSPYYFHRMFTAIVGKSMASYIRQRRIEKACALAAGTSLPLTRVGAECGFASQQAFNRAFKSQTGLAPGEYRRAGAAGRMEPVDEMIMRFTNRLKGGMIVNPNVIRRGRLFIAGVAGDGDKTGEVWAEFEKRYREIGLPQRLCENGYEVRYTEQGQTVQKVLAGYAVPENAAVDSAFTVMELPAGTYASFDVYVALGYTSENSAMSEWLDTNEDGYRLRLLGGEHYVVEYYDERFNGEAADSIVEIWVPVEK